MDLTQLTAWHLVLIGGLIATIASNWATVRSAVRNLERRIVSRSEIQKISRESANDIVAPMLAEAKGQRELIELRLAQGTRKMAANETRAEKNRERHEDLVVATNKALNKLQEAVSDARAEEQKRHAILDTKVDKIVTHLGNGGRFGS